MFLDLVFIFTLCFLWGMNLGEEREEFVLTTLPKPESYLFASHDSLKH